MRSSSADLPSASDRDAADRILGRMSYPSLLGKSSRSYGSRTDAARKDEWGEVSRVFLTASEHICHVESMSQ